MSTGGPLNRFYTVLIVPEKTSQVRRLVIPSWLLRGAAVGMALTVLLGGVMMFDYWYVMSQIGENRQLKLENRRLRQQVQIFQNRIATVESTMDRVKTFATRLKVIMHVEDQVPNIQGKLPDANSVASTAPVSPPQTAESESEPVLDPEKLELKKEYSILEKRRSLTSTRTQ